jgi:hypothetical protein
MASRTIHHGRLYRLRQADWLAIGKKLFGSDPMLWRFVCVSCGHVQTAADLVKRGVDPKTALQAAYVNCEGRYAGATSSPAGPDGCDWSLGGLLNFADVYVQSKEGRLCPVFAFDHPDAAAEMAAAPALEVAHG